jgi:hypothetical protein
MMIMRPTLAALTLVALAACGAPAGEAVAEDKAAPAASTAAAPTPAAASVPDETDAIMLASAASACEAEDYRAFFDAMISSAAVRRKYSAKRIDFTRFNASHTPYTEFEFRRIQPERYDIFPIQMVDHYRKSTAPAGAGDTSEHVMLQFNQSQSNQISVEWTRVRYDGKSEGGDDLGEAFDLDGQPYEAGGRTDGQLLLYPTATCWELVADNRYEDR